MKDALSWASSTSPHPEDLSAPKAINYALFLSTPSVGGLFIF